MYHLNPPFFYFEFYCPQSILLLLNYISKIHQSLNIFVSQVSVLCLVRDDTYYGQPATLLRDTNLLHEELQAQADKIDNFCLMKDIAVGSLCLVKYSGDWYRAEILSIAPLKVQLLDYGDCISCPAENLREIPTELKPRSRTIFKFKLAENASKKYYKKSVYSCLKIKPLHFSEKDNSWVVAVEGDPCPPTSLVSSFKLLKFKPIILKMLTMFVGKASQ